MSAFSREPLGLPIRGPMTHSQLALGIEATGKFFHEGDAWASEIIGEIAGISESLSELPGYRGSLGLGYPFYAMRSSKMHPNKRSVVDVPAVQDHIESAQELVEQSREFGGEVWPCATCQEECGLPDLKSQCKPCEKVLFKPRDLFKALPDIDVVTVFDGPNPEIEQS